MAFIIQAVEFGFPPHNLRTLGEKLISRHFWQGHLKAVSLGKTMWPQFWQISRALERTVIRGNWSPTMQ
jgi:hypothetical protein